MPVRSTVNDTLVPPAVGVNDGSDATRFPPNHALPSVSTAGPQFGAAVGGRHVGGVQLLAAWGTGPPTPTNASRGAPVRPVATTSSMPAVTGTPANDVSTAATSSRGESESLANLISGSA